MAQFQWSYSETDLPPNDAFPQGIKAKRAVIWATLEHEGKEVKDIPCLIDTGADYCQFPECFLSELGIDDSDIKCAPIDAIVVASAVIPFASVTLTIGGFDSLPICAGFSKELNKHRAGVLGFFGCLDQFRICLDPRNGAFVIGDYRDS